MGRPVVHWEFWSEDPGKISEFYEQVFGWDIRTIPDMDYRLVETGGEPGIKGGIMKPKAGPWSAKMAFYIDVDDIDSYSERIRQAGGKIVVAKTNVPGVGELSLFEDPDGRILGIWKATFREERRPVIRKLASGEYRLYSRKKDPRTGKRRNLGTFKTRAAAEKHERAVQYFKRRG